MTGKLLTAPEVAGLLGMRTDFVYALARRGEIPHLRFGRSLRFRAETIERWLEEKETSQLRGDRH